MNTRQRHEYNGDEVLPTGLSAPAVLADRRYQQDRRALSWRMLLNGHTLSRRRDCRRSGDESGVFVDWYHPWLFFLALGITLLSCVDAFMTVTLLDLGMVEANPVMAMALERGIGLFVVSKITITGIGIVTLVFLAETRFMNRLRTGLLLTALFSLYSCLVCYQTINLFRLL